MEIADICRRLEVQDCNITIMDSVAYKRIVLLACQKEDEKRLCKQAVGKEKYDRIFMDVYDNKEYFSNKTIYEVRQY